MVCPYFSLSPSEDKLIASAPNPRYLEDPSLDLFLALPKIGQFQTFDSVAKTRKSLALKIYLSLAYPVARTSLTLAGDFGF